MWRSDFCCAKYIKHYLILLQDGSGTSATAAKLKYSIFRNLAGIFKDQGDLAVAIDTYLKVSTESIHQVCMITKQQYS